MVEAARYDAIIVGSGPSGSVWARELTAAGLRCLVLEAGRFLDRETYPDKQVDSGTQLFWSGGLEPNTDATVAMLRPKVVGGGSVVNQALLDRFHGDAFPSWHEESGIAWFTDEHMAPWYDHVEASLALEAVPLEYANRSAELFRHGCEAKAYGFKQLRRAQRDCRFGDGNDCITCLSGCRVDSKQAMHVTFLHEALEAGAHVLSEFEVERIWETGSGAFILGRTADGQLAKFAADRVVLAAGAVGNSRILLRSGFGDRLPVGERFFCHPQRMYFGIFDEPVRAHAGAFQAYASDDGRFRSHGFKLENVYAPPADIAMLVPGIGDAHQQVMSKYDHIACVEVAIRDTNPGTIRVMPDGALRLEKRLNREDRARLARGTRAVKEILTAAGARRVVEGDPNIGLHLMGGCTIGTDPARSVVGPDFRVHGCKAIHIADSSIFPNAPGINPALTIMALAARAASEVTGGVA